MQAGGETPASTFWPRPVKLREILHLADQCDPVQFEKWAVQDSNSSENSDENALICFSGDAQSDALAAQVAEMIFRFTKLPAPIAIGIVAMVRSASNS
jgi:hypothetical protein